MLKSGIHRRPGAHRFGQTERFGLCTLVVATLSWIALFGAGAAGAAPLGVAHLNAILYFECRALLIAALGGILCGILARKLDRLEVVTNLLTIGFKGLDFVTNRLRRSARTA